MTLLDEVAGRGESGGTAADDSDALAGGRSDGRQTELAALKLEIGDKTLEVADGQRLTLAAEDAPALALILLRAHAAGTAGLSL
jgi:hypothetical protein